MFSHPPRSPLYSFYMESDSHLPLQSQSPCIFYLELQNWIKVRFEYYWISCQQTWSKMCCSFLQRPHVINGWLLWKSICLAVSTQQLYYFWMRFYAQSLDITRTTVRRFTHEEGSKVISFVQPLGTNWTKLLKFALVQILVGNFSPVNLSLATSKLTRSTLAKIFGAVAN